ncbi:hypothetical protein QBC40DRAFT_324193 [Triangularia verruculosa]|uniref:Uncharacterized protein n=1 Tax=Triangularia verruculosa TaxID=2587418 RepID=A0AAN6XIX2_9PEZI|nr:hypothetical protein QBC40DRAFT_324193 [Triangularia verruculosa]
MGYIKGTGIGNFKGLCEFLCERDYYPVGACLCQAIGSPRPEPSTQFSPGYPAPGLDENYSGLCAEGCRMGYCPTGICAEEPGPLTTPTISPFAPPACTSGTGSGQLEGLCNYACTLGFCPLHVCQCTSQGPLNVPPEPLDGAGSKPLAGLVDEGLCNFACSRGDYCPPSTCQNTTRPVGPVELPGHMFLDRRRGAIADGNNCYITSCLNRENLGYELNRDGWSSPSTWFRDDCFPDQYRLVIYPEFEASGECRWSRKAPFFCETGCGINEIAIAHTKWSGDQRCISGQQSLYCVSNTWARLVDSCEWAPLSSGCSADRVKLAQGQTLDYIRRGNGKNPAIDSAASQVLRSVYRPTIIVRAVKRKTRLLPPLRDGKTHFLLFPTLPPADYKATFTIGNPKPKLSRPGGLGTLQPFSFVVIDGPPDKVVSLNRRDGSHIHIMGLDCDPAVLKHQGNETYTARFICMDDSADSNCGDIHLGGAEGTIVKLPSDCGFAGHGVVHTIKPATDHSIAMSHGLRIRAPPNATIHELSFSYDFSCVKRADKSDPVYVRINYGTQNSLTRIRGSSKNGFLSVYAEGFQANIFRIGITLAGTISPTLYMEEARGFFNSTLISGGNITVDGKGTVNIPGTTPLRSLFLSQVSDWGYKVAGIVEINPRMDLEIQITGSGFMDRKFQVNFLTTPDQPLRLSSVKANQLVGKMGELAFDIVIPRTFSVRRESNDRVTIVDEGMREIFSSSPSDGGPPLRKPPNLPGVPVFDSRFNFMGCGAGREEIVCRNLDWLSANYAYLSFNNDEGGDVSEVTRRHSVIVPDSVQPHLAPRATGTARNFKVPQQRNGQNIFTTSSSTYPTGDNGQFLTNLNQNTGFYNLADAADCKNPGVVSTGDQNAAGYHGIQALAPPFPSILPWSQWDAGAPPGTHPNANISPEREMWDLIGSFVYPENMVNAHAAINMHKMQVLQLTGPPSDDRLRATGRIAQNGPRSNHLYRRYLNSILLPRIEASATGYFELIDRMIANWNRARSQTNPNTQDDWHEEIQGVLRTLDTMRRHAMQWDPVREDRSGKFKIRRDGLPPPPP